METIVFRKTKKGAEEVADRRHGLQQKLRRALIIIDGAKDVGELSVLMRPGEAEAAFQQLAVDGYIEAIGADELDPVRVAYTPFANDPAAFATIKRNAMREISDRVGPFADMINAEINDCETALDLRHKLRDIEDVLVDALGHEGGVQLAREIGGELTRLVPREA